MAPTRVPRAKRLRRVAAAVAAVLVGLVAAVWAWSLPARPDAFYDAPPATPATPGALVRSEPFARALPPGARAWRVLYTTTRGTGAHAVASGLVLAPEPLPAGPRPVVAWTHGTTGAATGCAPSLLAAPFAHVPALAPLLARGWVLVATDYVGLGTAGSHPYLIGDDAARSALDAVRAARRLDGLALADQTVVWGHSQGGHAALWTGIRAPSYAPDAGVAGVAALAPASLLPELVRDVRDTLAGRILLSFVLRAYADAYADVSIDAIVRPAARPFVRDMARRCMAGREALVSVLEAKLAPAAFAGDPTDGALGRRLAENVPQGAIAAPLLVAQGLADELVRPAVQQAFVAQRCAAGQPLAYRTYAGRDHLSLVAADSPLGDDLVAWTAARFAGAPAEPGCRTTRR